jgi:dTDP-4-dehydrorhamnose 3,5-epimerase
MNVLDTRIEGCLIIEPKVFEDSRGFFLETYQAERYREMLNIELPFVQDNHSRSQIGVLRGLHFQKTKPQGKLVRVVRGEVFDVAVDIRPDSPTFRQWQGVYLSEQNKKQLWVPPGLAHGFVVVSQIADLEYKCTDYYDPADEACLAWDDPTLNIEWPINDPMLSDKDKRGLSLSALQ